MSKRVWHELRVREKVGPDRYVKKSKFYEVRSPGDAVAIYEKHCGVEHTIMWCGKDRRHDPDRLVIYVENTLFRSLQQERVRPKGAFRELSSFFGLGDELLRGLRKGGDAVARVGAGRSNNRK